MVTDRTGTLRSVEKYDVLKEVWQQCTHLRTERIFPCAVVLSGFLYVAGGFNLSNQEIGTVEKYDPSTDTWCVVAELKKCAGIIIHSISRIIVY